MSIFTSLGADLLCLCCKSHPGFYGQRSCIQPTYHICSTKRWLSTVQVSEQASFTDLHLPKQQQQQQHPQDGKGYLCFADEEMQAQGDKEAQGYFPGMPTWNCSTQEAEAEGSQVQAYISRPYLRIKEDLV